MGLLVNGVWQDTWNDTKSNKGDFKREASQMRNWITIDGSPGPSGAGDFAAESGRYHLYVSWACPWASRALLFRALKNLENHISVSIVSPDMLDYGWTFAKDKGSTGDDLYNLKFLHEIYTKSKPDYTGRVTVPVLWDKHNARIVNNESAEIIRMFNSAFNEITGNHHDFYPMHLRNDIDNINQEVYEYINNGVYRCGFATSQEAYENAYHSLFAELDKLEKLLSEQEFLVGNEVTEADWRLFVTLIRFDPVYYGHFKCNKKRLIDYPALSNYIVKLYQWPGVSDTVNFNHIKRHYYYSQATINPTQIVPVGPEIDYI